MANAFSQIYLQFVFAVQGRQNVISPNHKDELHDYIGRLVSNQKVKMLAIHCLPDHCHILVSFKPVITVDDFVNEIKCETNEFINSKKWIKGRFCWQEGYGVFSYSRSDIPTIAHYIRDQENYHRKKSFVQEYKELLEKFQSSIHEKYLFQTV
jgi:REP element-mobilizing transposase RayT